MPSPSTNSTSSVMSDAEKHNKKVNDSRHFFHQWCLFCGVSMYEVFGHPEFRPVYPPFSQHARFSFTESQLV